MQFDHKFAICCGLFVFRAPHVLCSSRGAPGLPRASWAVACVAQCLERPGVHHRSLGEEDEEDEEPVPRPQEDAGVGAA